jgi:hypothetical protein
LRQLARLEAIVNSLLEQRTDDLDRLLPLELQREDRFGEVAAHVRQKWRVLAERGLTNPTLADANVTLPALIEWYREHFGPIHSNLEEHARRLGFEGRREFLTEVLAEYMAREERSIDASARAR